MCNKNHIHFCIHYTLNVVFANCYNYGPDLYISKKLRFYQLDSNVVISYVGLKFLSNLRMRTCTSNRFSNRSEKPAFSRLISTVVTLFLAFSTYKTRL